MFNFVAGVRQEQDIYVRLIDSVTKQVSASYSTQIDYSTASEPSGMLNDKGKSKIHPPPLLNYTSDTTI